MKWTFFIALMCSLMTTAQAEDIILTVYNRDLAVVKIADEMNFKKGRQTISLTGVADRIDPTSVRFSTGRDDVSIIEQNYRYDLVNSAKILQRYIDNTVTVRLKEGEMIEGTLLSAAGDVVIKSCEGKLNIISVDAVERYEFPDLPEGLITRPTLFWDMYSKKEARTPTEISYMTAGVSWHAEYTAVVGDDDTSLELSSWVSVENNSGTTFDDAVLKLVAGDIHRAPQAQPEFGKRMMLAETDAAPRGFEERGLFEYHLYELQQKTTISNAEIKQISLFDPVSTGVAKLFVYDIHRNPAKVAVAVEFVNAEQDGLGMPLPAGTVRVYKRDTDSGLELIGEDAIGHTPKNEKVRLNLGYAFDIVGERRVVESKRISQRVREDNVEISLRNRKDEPVQIIAVEHLRGDWDVRDSSHKHTKNDARTIEFTVTVKQDSETVITYTVRYR
ncbi:DUF4139 domain-containing protein [Candidatus Latescibacterota bacterium]